VPEFTMRTISTHGTRAMTALAISFSRAQGAPKDVPFASWATSASRTSGWA